MPKSKNKREYESSLEERRGKVEFEFGFAKKHFKEVVLANTEGEALTPEERIRRYNRLAREDLQENGENTIGTADTGNVRFGMVKAKPWYLQSKSFLGEPVEGKASENSDTVMALGTADRFATGR